MTDTSPKQDGPKGPKGEVLDYVERKGPISIIDIVEEVGVWSPDEVFSWLEELEDDDLVESMRGDIDEHGTTRRVYVKPGGDFNGE